MLFIITYQKEWKGGTICWLEIKYRVVFEYVVFLYRIYYYIIIMYINNVTLAVNTTLFHLLDNMTLIPVCPYYASSYTLTENIESLEWEETGKENCHQRLCFYLWKLPKRIDCNMWLLYYHCSLICVTRYICNNVSEEPGEWIFRVEKSSTPNMELYILWYRHFGEICYFNLHCKGVLYP